MICSLGCVWNATAEALEICGDVKQGELIVIKGGRDIVLYDDATVKDFIAKGQNLQNKKEYMISSDGTTLVALPRDAAQKVIIADYPGNDYGTIYEMQVAPAQWDIQRVEGVKQHHVTPDKRHDAEIAREQADVRRALGTKKSTYSDVERLWQEGFILPVDGQISGNFGNQRIFNGVPKSPHSGTDIAAPEGTPVKASGSGKVVLSGQDYFYTGNMVIIDHGHQLQTIYAHLKKATVEEGDLVKQGDVIGYVGKTGRATGAHLHWGASLNNVRFRPHSLLDINEKKCQHLNGIYVGSLVED